ncbi:hypothetical protein EW093_07345 [Thiospirochaeta perfilievii]|uniref:DNA/pantothenate metabolism flavoprotein C-terminal domain-containing protein n=1 Tax=Thiospirochaeta perfilievii TaxID=252967 RepID=A0A5C1QAI8_9SPIO|nr:phosphopantothenoylcysteine decarboxylase [Thiospirochaeta perfilievii]QEN04521.1 hypothetical protein EW093_07345 [Thiospirochaeta perfilievii]
MEILITAGGTEEPIDGVRTITNFSTGRTGATLADIFYENGFKVTLLTSYRGVKPKSPVEIVEYKTFEDLDRNLEKILGKGNINGVIHLAAVSDYSVDYLLIDGVKILPQPNLKLDSNKGLSIVLKPNYKIIERVKKYSTRPITLVGFKLTKNATDKVIKSKVESLFKSGEVDFVVQNDLTSIDKNSHYSAIYTRDGVYKSCTNKQELAISLVNIFREI